MRDAYLTGPYRYGLYRSWADEGKRVLFIMLNPSTADADRDDPTIRKCMGFARRWGFSGVEVVNLFAFRATHPRDLWNKYFDAETGQSAIGPENDLTIHSRALLCDTIVCAWGAIPQAQSVQNRKRRVIENLRTYVGRAHPVLYCLGRTGSGEPRHPLMLSYQTPQETYARLSPCE